MERHVEILPAAENLPVPRQSAATIDYIVNAIAQQVVIRVKAEILDHLEHTAPQIAPALLCVKDAAIYLGRSEQAIQHLIFSHELPVVRCGRRVHLDRHDLDAWIEKNKY